MTTLQTPHRKTRTPLRKSFSRIGQPADMPNLIEIQKNSYDRFLQMDNDKKRGNYGLENILDSMFPIKSFSGHAQLEYVRYQFETPKYEIEECRHRALTYEAPLKVSLRLVVFDINEAGEKKILNVKEQDIYMGEVPLMTGDGTFIINGSERVIVSQMHRSPGVFFDHDKGRSHSSGKLLFAARVIPYRGSWLDFEFDAKDILYTRIDRRRKIPATILLRALGMSTQDIMERFYPLLTFTRSGKDGWHAPFIADRWLGVRPIHDLVDAKTGKVLAEKGRRITRRTLRDIAAAKTKNILVTHKDMEGLFSARSIPNPLAGKEESEPEFIAQPGDEIDEKMLAKLEAIGINELDALDVAHLAHDPFIRNTAMADKCTTTQDALNEIYRVMRPGDPPAADAPRLLFKSLFFDSERYDLSAVGRVKLNMRLELDTPDTQGVLDIKDITAIMRTLVDLRIGNGDIDDIDSLGNRRVRSVGELIENQYRLGLLRAERAVRERMSSGEIDATMPQDLINAKPIVALVREFFSSSQLSQFMDQTNPLSEVTHKRRLSALGPGGLQRDRAGFEVRDVHPTHYGRVCPVETPEGPNIGLINSLATHARINKYGLIESPYRRVTSGRITSETVYLSAMEESRYRIGQANIKIGKDNKIEEQEINCRYGGGFEIVPPEKVDFVDLSPCQIVSAAAALVPFLENDDANRALMGANMQRQAVPLMRTEAPLVGTGMESTVARDSGSAIIARRAGTVDQVDAKRIFIRANEAGNGSETGPVVDIYNLRKFQRSNQSTCINQRPLVYAGQEIAKGEIIADGPAIDHGELALGRNVLVAFMPWHGYNFEDAILVSERLVRDDVFTSIHIKEFEVTARDTKLGPEEITRDIPNIGEEARKNLDEVGIIYVGAQVKAGDILVGKTTPKSEAPMTPEEKLLRSIFGEKAAEVRDTSLRMPPGSSGTVVEVRVFNRHGVEKDERALSISTQDINRLARDRDDERRVLERNTAKQLAALLLNKQAASAPAGALKNGGRITQPALDELSHAQWWKIVLKDQKAQAEAGIMRGHFDAALKRLNDAFEAKVEKMQRGDDMPPGVMKTIKVFVAVKRKIQQGDKMAGRHGNKGIISKITPVEDMPYLEDGTPVDIVLNPLGVPSRMNVGQILETHLGWACAGMGRKIAAALEEWQAANKAAPVKKIMQDIYGAKHTLVTGGDEVMIPAARELAANGVPIATPVFDGAHESDIADMLAAAGLEGTGQVTLYDGRTGEAFARPITVGYIYMLKLHHLVDDKIHARSVGPYSLVTQQPLGGKAQFGGQRFGEMEVWALEAYGAAYTLQEILTIKSDDVAGRIKTYEQIVQGEDTFTTGIPESFNVLVLEMRALGLNVELLTSKQAHDALPKD